MLCQRERSFQGDLILDFQYIKAAYEKREDRFFSRTSSNRTRTNGFKLKEGQFVLDIRKNSFMMWLVKPWNSLPGEVVNAPSLEILKAKLDRTLSNQIWLKMMLVIGGGVGLYHFSWTLLTQTRL